MFIEFYCSYYGLWALRRGYLIHRVTWIIDNLITWYAKQNFISSFAREMTTNFTRCDFSWVDLNHWVTFLIYHVIMLYWQKGASPVSQRQWTLNLVRLWVRVKGHHLLSQVTCWSSDHMHLRMLFYDVMYPLTQDYRTQLEISNRKTYKLKAFLLFKRN